MARRTRGKGLTVGFLGKGEQDLDQGMTWVQEFHDARLSGDDPLRWIFIITDDLFTQTLIEYAAMAKESHISYFAITRPDEAPKKAFNEIKSGAAEVITVEDPILQMEQLLKEANTEVALFALWDERGDSDEQQEIFGTFLDAEIPVYDLRDSLVPMGADEDAGNGEAAIEAEEGDELEIFARTDLAKMSLDELKEIGKQLGIQPKRTKDAMIDLIMEAQGEPEAEEPEPEPEPAVAEPDDLAAAEDLAGVLIASFTGSLADFQERLSATLDEFINRLEKVELKVAAPSSEPEPEKPQRRVIRRG